MSSRIKLLFTISVILNFLLAGVIIGHYSKHIISSSETAHYLPEEFTENISPEKQVRVAEMLRELREVNRPVREEIRQSKRDIADLLAMKEFDEELYDLKVAHMHGLYRSMAERRASVIKEIAIMLDHEERVIFADYLKKRQQKRERHKSRKGKNMER